MCMLSFSQTAPLDFGTHSFYSSREKLFSHRLQWIRSTSTEVSEKLLSVMLLKATDSELALNQPVRCVIPSFCLFIFILIFSGAMLSRREHLVES